MNKKNLILIIVLLVLIGVAFIYNGPFKSWQKTAGQDKNWLAGYDISKITKLEIKSSGKVTTLEKQGDNYKISGTKNFFTDKTVASDIEKILRDAQKDNLQIASKNKDRKKDFATDDSGVAVKLFFGDKVQTDFVAGKMTPDYSSAYISRDSLDRTYLIPTNLSAIFSRQDWFDHTMFSADKATIKKIRFQYPSREFTIEKQANGEDWKGTLPQAFAVNKDKVAPILDIMASLQADSIPDQDFSKTGLDKSSVIVQATGDGVDNTLMIGNDNGKSLYYAKIGKNDNIYLLTKKQHDDLVKRVEDLK